jgi:uncharacterized protein YqgQ
MVPTLLYTIEVIKQEASQLVDRGLLQRKSPIYHLCQYIPPREWHCVECELERNDYLLRDPILDLLGREDWEED